MVSDSGAAARADQLRPLNAPRPIRVLARNGVPTVLIAVAPPHRRERVARVQDVWRVDDEWWRCPVSRCYYRLVLEQGSVRTVYHDLIADAWYEQAY